MIYGLLSEQAIALVVTSDAGRIVRLGGVREISAAADALHLGAPEGDPDEALDALREVATVPLGLPEGARRILVSPEGALSYVPFAMLLPDREIAYVPSGTMLGLLLEERARRGEGILAVADPHTGARESGPEAPARRGPFPLADLPAAREEVRAFGTEFLIGPEATEAAFRLAVARRPRWRAVHLACHGFADPIRPTLSWLALTPADDDDGFLTALDVFRTRIPTDLVVLSACETGRGKIVKGEGILGLTRAFMCAGAPRVIVSLWRVDDKATGALMKKFYELWSPSDGAPALRAAAALKAAQAHVRRQPGWEHPYYWGAWVLWGLPE